MSKIAIYYVIRPQQSLLQAIEASGVEAAELLSETELWEGDWLFCDGAIPNRSSDPHDISRVKLLFLGRIAWDYATENATDEAVSSGFKDFVCALRELKTGLHPTTFDRWWTIERLEGPDFKCADLENELKDTLIKYGRSS